MTAPFFGSGGLGATAALWLALPLGLAFGVVLERAGLADPRKLAAQFTLTDLTVLKVMMTAIVTASVGLFWLARVGWLDTAAVYLPPTHLLPQLIGGLVFGVGFVVGGYCPGTSCVAAAAGRGDALALIGGMLAGTLAFAEAFRWIRPLYEATPLGPVTWYALAGLSQGAGVALLVLAAVGAFALAERIERKPPFGRRRGLVAALAGSLALLTAAAGGGVRTADRAPRPLVPVAPDSLPAAPPAKLKSDSPIKC